MKTNKQINHGSMIRMKSKCSLKGKEYEYTLFYTGTVKISRLGFLVGLMEYDKFISHYEVKTYADEPQLKSA